MDDDLLLPFPNILHGAQLLPLVIAAIIPFHQGHYSRNEYQRRLQ